jgi:hypothetical protein
MKEYKIEMKKQVDIKNEKVQEELGGKKWKN